MQFDPLNISQMESEASLSATKEFDLVMRQSAILLWAFP